MHGMLPAMVLVLLSGWLYVVGYDFAGGGGGCRISIAPVATVVVELMAEMGATKHNKTSVRPAHRRMPHNRPQISNNNRQ